MEVAVAALGRLQGLEKQLKNEDYEFSGETVQHLEDTIAAIKKLEEIRRHTLERLEEETIENSKLRVRTQTFPGVIMAEMTALVTAAREASAAQIDQLQSALKHVAHEIASLDEKQNLSEKQNAALCEEQARLRLQYEERVDLLNERMARKVNTNVLLNDTCEKTRDTEREIIRAKAALKELKEKVAEKMNKLRKEKEDCELKEKEMKKILDAQQAKTSEKRDEFEALNIKLLNIEHLITMNSMAISNEEALIAKCKATSKQLEKNLDLKKTNMLELLKKKDQLESDVRIFKSKFAQEKEALNKELERITRELQNVEHINKRLKFENKSAHQKYQQLEEEQQHWALKRDKTVAKLGKLSALLNENLELLSNRMVEEKSLEEEIENLEDNLLYLRESYEKGLKFLEQDLKSECEMRAMLQWKKLHLTKQKNFFLSREEERKEEVNERIEAGKEQHAKLLLEIEDLEKEVLQSENQVEALNDEINKREADYRIYKEDFTNKIKCLENDFKTVTENLHQKEQELNISKLTLEETQRELKENQAKYEELSKSFLKRKDEEIKARKSIERSIKTTEKLKEGMRELRKKLRIKRGAALDQLKQHTESAKWLERDIYEINRKLDLVHTENCRLKACNAQIKEDIFAINFEAENHKSATAKILNDLAVFHDLLLKGWSEDSSMQEEFLENEREILKAVTALITKIRQREEKLSDINRRLQNKLEGLNSLAEKASRVAHCKTQQIYSFPFLLFLF
ncbi:PREDICTED: myosin-6-like [Tinamus guttatus]|uniref:myosin-6-like n=1 Tax=Tinamus guttatus TaxID=94827 RepID=UPI00052EB27A|nr:PREDICTED: myosin-6-like [Tinamus guttatus]